MTRLRCSAAGVALVALACGADDDGERRALGDPDSATAAHPYWQPDSLTSEQLESGRLDPSWRTVVDDDIGIGDTGAPAAGRPSREGRDTITVANVETGPMRLPLRGDAVGASVLRLQVLLDRALFSPGVIDGRWGKNTEKALYWFQRQEGLTATGVLDRASFSALVRVAGEPASPLRRHRLTQQDVAGPFVRMPSDIYERAQLDCSCYESLPEKLAELFHTTPELLRRLNEGVDLGGVRAGTGIVVPNIRGPAAIRGDVARLVVSDRGHFVHAVDSAGRLLYHFPSTLGSSYDPSPSGNYAIRSITKDPWWHYQPDLLASVPDTAADARIPPGPNNAVGAVWMALTIPHYGIHGTAAPQTIGYVTSAGCVRLTNWDALFLADRVREGTPVEFRDT